METSASGAIQPLVISKYNMQVGEVLENICRQATLEGNPVVAEGRHGECLQSEARFEELISYFRAAVQRGSIVVPEDASQTPCGKGVEEAIIELRKGIRNNELMDTLSLLRAKGGLTVVQINPAN